MYWPAVVHADWVVITDGVVVVHAVDTYSVVPGVGIGQAVHVPADPGELYVP